MPKQGSVEAAKPHTFEAKHPVLRFYLGAWCPILLRSGFAQKLTLLDAFAGPGVYPNGMPGSPVIIIQELLEVLDGQTPPIPIELIFIENDRKDFARLEETLAFWIPKLPDGVTVTARQGRCQDLAHPLLLERGSLGPKRPILALFDAEGFDIPLSLVRTIARNPSSEVMVTLLTAEFVRFAGKPNEKADACFGDTEWRKVAKAPPSEKNQFIVDEYEKRVKGAPFKHVHTFTMTLETGYRLHLVFGTNHIKGYRAMNRGLWKVDPVRGQQYRDTAPTDQLGFGFDQEADLVPLQILLRDGLLSDQGWHPVEAVRRSMWSSRFEEKHVYKALEEMLRAKHLERRGGKNARLTGDVEVRLMQSLF